MEIIISIAVVVILFLIFRAFVLWYWRVTETIELLQDISDKLTLLIKK
jgi:hypothetical protein